MYTMYASAFGEVTERMIKYFVRRAKGGIGMIVLENTCIEWDYGRVDGGRSVAIHRDCFIPELHRLVESVQRHGVKIVTQLQHVGRQTFSSNIDGRQPIAPSAVQSKVGAICPVR
jgi:2,4-dienoyl-CoA reductase (NADPH2)